MLTLPTDWTATHLDGLTDPSRPIRYGIVQPGQYDPNGRYMIRGQDYSAVRGWANASEFFRVSAEVEARYRNARVRAGDLLMTIVGAGTGHVESVPQWLDGANLTQTTARIAIQPGSAVAAFCKYYLQSVLGQTQVATYMKGAAQPGLNIGDVKKFVLALPPIDEQEAIADALFQCDRLISSIADLISKKQAVKKGMMQQLLSGTTRLPGFTRTWSDVVVADLLGFKNGLNKGSEFFGTGTPIVNFMDVMSGPIITQRDVQGQVTLTRDEIKRFSALKNDLFFTRTSESVDEVGTTAVLVDDVKDAVFSGFVLRGRPRDGRVDSRFLAYRLHLADARSQITSTATYTTRALTNGTALGRIALRLPQRDEQAAIADVVGDVDAEIRWAQRRLAKARDIKAGMMQELLTGRTRLPVKRVA